MSLEKDNGAQTPEEPVFASDRLDDYYAIDENLDGGGFGDTHVAMLDRAWWPYMFIRTIGTIRSVPHTWRPRHAEAATTVSECLIKDSIQCPLSFSTILPRTRRCRVLTWSRATSNSTKEPLMLRYFTSIGKDTRSIINSNFEISSF